MDKEFIPYQEAIELKELGFDDPCFTHYLNSVLLTNSLVVDKREINSYFDQIRVAAPLYQQAFRWFRKNYRLHSEITVGVKGFTFLWRPYYDTNGKNPNNSVFDIESFKGQFVFFESFEEAELACLKELIKITKNKLD